MARWEPNARERLAKAALELFEERGYDQTAVADIAARAGLTERTFFRYFADKREVLFGGSTQLKDMLEGSIAAAPGATAPIDTVAGALEATSPFFDEHREFSRARQAVISAHPALQERELIKLASLSAAMAAALQRRGTPEPAAILAAETGTAVFKLAFARWVADGEDQGLAHHLREALAQLKAVALPPQPEVPAVRRQAKRAG